MNFKKLKLELFHLRKAHQQYHQLNRYIFTKHFLNRRILRFNGMLERPATVSTLSVHTMLGHQHLLMALWSVASFYATSKSTGKLYLHSDGTLTARDARLLNHFFPSAEIIDPREVLVKYQEKYDRYPRIRDFRKAYQRNFFQTKLIDPFVIAESEMRLFFDIDVLWFRNSEIIEEEIRALCPHSLMMTSADVKEGAHGSFNNNVIFKDGSRLGEGYASYNGGIMLYHRDRMPAEKLADYLDRLDMTRAESWHWVEQAGYASLMENIQKLPTDRYLMKGNVTEQVVARHYTGPRRVEFYLEGLPKVRDLLWRKG